MTLPTRPRESPPLHRERIVVTLMVLTLGVLMQVGDGVRGDCTKKTACSCEGPDGTVDLSPLDGGSTPKFKDLADQQASGWLFSFNPCSAFDEADSCSSVSACQVASDQSSSYALGTQDSATFITDPTTGDLNLQYTATDSLGTTRTTVVSLLCDQTVPDGNLVVVGETTQATYAMALSSVHCCPTKGPGPPGPGPNGGGGGGGGLSVGSYLVIGVVVLLVVYAVGGVLIQTYVRKAAGRERIPNYGLWSAVPGLIKDGVLFTVTLGRRGGYDKV